MVSSSVEGGAPDADAVPHLFRRGMRLIGRSLRATPATHAVAISGALVFAIAAVGLTRVLGWATDNVIGPGLDGDGVTNRQLWNVVLLVMLVGVLRGTGALVRRYFLAMAEYRTQRLWRRQLFDQYLELPVAFHQARPTGELLAHVDNDIMMATSMLKPLAFAVGTVALLAASMGSLLEIHPYLAIVALVLFPILAIMNQAYTSRVEAPSARVQQQVGSLSNIAHESFDGVLVVKALGRESAEVERFAAAADRLRAERVGIGRMRALFEPAIDSLPNIGIVALLMVGAGLIDSGSITVGDLVGAMALFSILALPIRIIGFFLEEMPKSVVALERIDNVLAVPRPAERGGHDTPIPDGPLPVNFSEVALGYDGHEVLTNVSFDVAAGESVAIVGATGSGKSSLSRLLVDLTPPDRGRVKIGGVTVADAVPADLHASVSLVFQETFLFAESVAANISLGREASRADIEQAARLAGAHNFISALPEGYDTVVGERGVTLSGGQRQRVALARALAGSPRVLFLDDATSAVDPVIESEILDNLRHRLSMTLLVVAHRLSTIKLADRIVFIADGTVAATGTHDDLLALPAYEALVRAYEEAAV